MIIIIFLHTVSLILRMNVGLVSGKIYQEIKTEFHFRPDAQAQINGYTAARYKKFDTKDEAEEFVRENALNKPVVDRREKASGDSQVGKTVL